MHYSCRLSRRTHEEHSIFSPPHVSQHLHLYGVRVEVLSCTIELKTVQSNYGKDHHDFVTYVGKGVFFAGW